MGPGMGVSQDQRCEAREPRGESEAALLSLACVRAERGLYSKSDGIRYVSVNAEMFIVDIDG